MNTRTAKMPATARPGNWTAGLSPRKLPVVFLFFVTALVAFAAHAESWEEVYQERLGWWSLQPVADLQPPDIRDTSWPRNDLDCFVLSRLEGAGLSPAPEADRRVLARRLSFALTGLPPKPADVERFVWDDAPDAYDRYVQALLDSPHFGERWARHWMDVVHYADTHGYEWDTPAKSAWMYRDYLIRAFNADVSFKQLILEQLAGDLIEPRIDAATGLNESLIGPMSMRLGERRHGDNGDAEGVTQEAVANMIDTVSKGYLATTVACAQCHDHKLDAVAQQDYFGLAGIFMSSRWYPRCVDTVDPNVEVIAELKAIKDDIRAEVLALWRKSEESIAEAVLATPPEEAPKNSDKKKADETAQPEFPNSAIALWRALKAAISKNEPVEAVWDRFAEEYRAERAERAAENAANLRLIADFTGGVIPEGWRIDGSGMANGFVGNGEIVVADKGGAAIAHVLPAGRWSHVWSARLAGAVRSPLLEQEPPLTFSVGYAGGQYAAQSLVVENAFHSERMMFLDQPMTGWLTMTARKLAALAGGTDNTARRVYLEMVTKALNNYFPPRTMYRGLKEADEKDPRSWFGVTRVYKHAAGAPPKDERAHFATLFVEGIGAPTAKDELASRFAQWIAATVEHWAAQTCGENDVRIINEALAASWLPNDALANPHLAQLVARYRETETRLQPDRTIGSADDWREGRDERIGVRGSYTEFGDPAPRGAIRFLGGPAPRTDERSSGRLEFARGVASDDNPLTARVFVNRVWCQLFGEGIVRTVDDFGHLGETPSHPELLDWLARRFMDDGWSLKQLVKLMVASSTWRQSCVANDQAVAADPENRLWHHMPLRRLDAESIRDAMLAASGRLDDTMFGLPIEPNRAAEDPAKRLFNGPIDGDGRRSIYIEMTMMEPPKFLALFNQPIAKLCTGKRDATNVPNQALAMLNDPFVAAMAKHWGGRVVNDGLESPGQRAQGMFATAFGRTPGVDEVARIVALANRCAELHGVDPNTMMACGPVWRDVAHALFNLKEFIYVQ